MVPLCRTWGLPVGGLHIQVRPSRPWNTWILVLTHLTRIWNLLMQGQNIEGPFPGGAPYPGEGQPPLEHLDIGAHPPHQDMEPSCARAEHGTLWESHFQGGAPYLGGRQPPWNTWILKSHWRRHLLRMPWVDCCEHGCCTV